MKKRIPLFTCFFLLVLFSIPCTALDKTYRIEVLQVTGIGPYQSAYTGFIQELQKNDIVQGKNLQIKRTIIDFDVDKAGLWKKIGVLMRITSETQKIVDRKPDLVLTIGTPATKYAKDKIIAAGIPLVFTGVAIPTAAGCKSQTESGQGFTGATLYMDMNSVVKIIRLAFPKIKTLGVIHSEDENAVEQVAQLKKSTPSVGIKVISRQIDKNAHITPVAEELMNQGIDGTIIPLDTYYGMRNYEATNELRDLNNKWKKPGICLVYWKSPGAILYIGADFKYIGSLSGLQAAKILKEGVKPESLPIMRQEDLGIMVDTKEMKLLGIELPLQILQIAKSVE
jgi:putative tryptophan/tyrosine transport system substrate-binding protein